jgi:hypothetical protein
LARSHWTVTRRDNEVRVDVVDSASLEQADFQAIVEAVQEHLAEDGITTVRLDGPVLEAAPQLDGLNAFIPRLMSLVDERAVRLYVGPIWRPADSMGNPATALDC